MIVHCQQRQKKKVCRPVGNLNARGYEVTSKSADSALDANVIVGSGDKKDEFFEPQSKHGEIFTFFWARWPKQVFPFILRSRGFSGEAKYFFASSLLPQTRACCGRGGV